MPSYWCASSWASTRSTPSWSIFSFEPLETRSGLAVIRCAGRSALAAFEREAGGHRFQRVPPTEKRGRVHSSTVTVAVLPEPKASALTLPASDLRFETYRAPGPGGQHRNTSDTAVRVTHLPTGIQASSAHKSQSRNKTLALAELRARLAARSKTAAGAKRNAKRKKQVGTGERADKIRTVAYQRQRVENHLNGKRMKIRDYERGMLRKIL